MNREETFMHHNSKITVSNKYASCILENNYVANRQSNPVGVNFFLDFNKFLSTYF